VLFELAMTKAWLRQVIVGLTLICRSSYRGVVEFLRDVLGVPVNLGCVHDVLQADTRQASAINRNQNLSGIRVGLHDEIFQGATPVPAGVDAASTYCYILAAERRRDADTLGVHLLDAVSRAMADTPRSSALVENLNSRLRTYFTPRRHLGGSLVHLRAAGCCLGDWDIIWQPKRLPLWPSRLAA